MPAPLDCTVHGIMGASCSTNRRIAAVVVWSLYFMVWLAGVRRGRLRHLRSREVPLCVVAGHLGMIEAGSLPQRCNAIVL